MRTKGFSKLPQKTPCLMPKTGIHSSDRSRVGEERMDTKQELNEIIDALVGEVIQGTLIKNIRARLMSKTANVELVDKLVRLVEIRSGEFMSYKSGMKRMISR